MSNLDLIKAERKQKDELQEKLNYRIILIK
jgi:hypothetical protein